MQIKHFFKKAALYPLAIAIMVWEDAFYKPVNALGQYLGRHPSLKAVQVKISNMPPWAALAIFVVPVVTLFPFKMAGLWLLGQGHPILGGAIFASAKIVGAALFTRIFTLTEKSIRQISIVNTSLDFFFDKKDKLVNYWKASRAYANIHELKIQVKEKYKEIKESLGFTSQKNDAEPKPAQDFLNEEKLEIKSFFSSASIYSAKPSHLGKQNKAINESSFTDSSLEMKPDSTSPDLALVEKIELTNHLAKDGVSVIAQNKKNTKP